MHYDECYHCVTDDFSLHGALHIKHIGLSPVLAMLTRARRTESKTEDKRGNPMLKIILSKGTNTSTSLEGAVIQGVCRRGGHRCGF